MSELQGYFNTIAQSGTSHLRERGSRFFGYAFRVENTEQIKSTLLTLRTQYPDATHHCFAWIIDEQHYRASDDGEPSYSAGQPILRAIRSAGVEQVLVVVVRYFGGKQLGVSGLIEAYGACAAEALKASGAIKILREAQVNISLAFEHENQIYQAFKQLPVKIRPLYQESEVQLHLTYPIDYQAQVTEILSKLPCHII